MTIEEHFREIAKGCFTMTAAIIEAHDEDSYRVGIFNSGPSPEMAVMRLIQHRAKANGMTVEKYLGNMRELIEGEEKCAEQELYF